MYGWWRSKLDGQVHAFDLLANLGQPELTAVCGHTVPRDKVKEEDWLGGWDRACLDALNDGIPQKRLLAELDKSRAEWRAKRAKNTPTDEPNASRIIERHPV